MVSGFRLRGVLNDREPSTTRLHSGRPRGASPGPMVRRQSGHVPSRCSRTCCSCRRTSGKPTKFWLATLPANLSLKQLVLAREGPRVFCSWRQALCGAQGTRGPGRIAPRGNRILARRAPRCDRANLLLHLLAVAFDTPTELPPLKGAIRTRAIVLHPVVPPEDDDGRSARAPIRRRIADANATLLAMSPSGNACSGRRRSLIPGQADRRFRRKAITDSGASRSLNA